MLSVGFFVGETFLRLANYIEFSTNRESRFMVDVFKSFDDRLCFPDYLLTIEIDR